jgi:hypothetical protein
MKAIHFLLGLFLYLAIAAGALALMASTHWPDGIQIVLAWAQGVPAWGRVALGTGAVLYLFVFLLTGLAWRRKRAFIVFENENGTVSVSTEAVQDYLDGLKDEFAAVAWLKTHLRAVRGALAVGLVLGVRTGRGFRSCAS